MCKILWNYLQPSHVVHIRLQWIHAHGLQRESRDTLAYQKSWSTISRKITQNHAWGFSYMTFVRECCFLKPTLVPMCVPRAYIHIWLFSKFTRNHAKSRAHLLVKLWGNAHLVAFAGHLRAPTSTNWWARGPSKANWLRWKWVYMNLIMHISHSMKKTRGK